MSKIIVAWAVTFDNIMSYTDNLKDTLEKSWKNTSYFVNSLSIAQWWSWLNMSYNLSLLWETSTLVSWIWKDFDFSDFINENTNLDNVLVDDKELTSRSFITTDSEKNIISSTYLWALNAIENIDLNVFNGTKYAIVNALPISIMVDLLKKLKEAWLEVFFSPWNMISKMTKYEIEKCFSYSDYLIVNNSNYEKLKLLWEKTDEEMISIFEKMIITYGINGSKVFDKSYNMIEVPWVNNPDFKDNIWVGDAYKAWLLKWLTDWFSWEQSAKMWAVLASISTWTVGWSSHEIDFDKFQKLYLDTFGEGLN